MSKMRTLCLGASGEVTNCLSEMGLIGSKGLDTLNGNCSGAICRVKSFLV